MFDEDEAVGWAQIRQKLRNRWQIDVVNHSTAGQDMFLGVCMHSLRHGGDIVDGVVLLLEPTLHVNYTAVQ